MENLLSGFLAKTGMKKILFIYLLCGLAIGASPQQMTKQLIRLSMNEIKDEFGDKSGGRVVHVNMDRTFLSPPYIVKLSVWREKDPFHPKNDINSIQSTDDIKWNAMMPLTFNQYKVSRGVVGYDEDLSKYETHPYLTFERKDKAVFDIELPYFVFIDESIFDTPEKKNQCVSVTFFIKAAICKGNANNEILTNSVVLHTTRIFNDYVPPSNVTLLGTDDLSALLGDDEKIEGDAPPIVPPEDPSKDPKEESKEKPTENSEEEPTETPTNRTPKFIPPPTPKPHRHSFATSINFGTPLTVRTKKAVVYDFPKSVEIQIDGIDYRYTKATSDLGDNVYLCEERLKGLGSIEDAEKKVSEINDSLQKAESGYAVRLATKKEASQKYSGIGYVGEENFEYFFDSKGNSIILALEYNKDRNGMVVVPDHVKVLEFITHKCNCGERRTITYQRQFKSMSQCRAYMNNRRK